jgi:broad specificity phosphatase PhoE
MKLYLVRHGHAGSRSSWTGDDRLRPLSKKGRRQAAALAQELAGAGITRLVSSPSVRCIETLRPLADQVGLVVEDDDRLAEGSDGRAALELADELRRDDDGAAVVCSHGDVIPDLLFELRGNGTVFHDPPSWPKGSVWLVSSRGSEWTDARYVTRA